MEMNTNTNIQYRACLNTEDIDFEAYGSTSEEAKVALIAGLQAHAKQAGLPLDWHTMLDQNLNCYAVQNGHAYRGGKCLTLLEADATLPTPLYLQAFPDFGKLDVEIPPDFEDVSWKNDECPSFTKYFFNGQSLRLWVDYQEPDRRAYTGANRYSVGLYDFEETFLRTLVKSDDFSTIERTIEDFEPAPTPFQFIRDVSRMTRTQINDLYQEKVGYRPDDEKVEAEDVLILNTAEITFYHAGGEESHWPREGAAAMLSQIRANDLRLGMANRRFSIHARNLPVSFVHDDAPLSDFLRMDELSAWDRFDIELLPVGVALYLDKGEGCYVVTRLK